MQAGKIEATQHPDRKIRGRESIRSKKYFELEDKIRNYLVCNLKSFDSDDIKKNLFEAANLLGFHISFKHFKTSGPKRKASSTLWIIDIDAVGKISWSEDSPFKGVRIPHEANHYFYVALQSKTPFFSDFLRCIKGLEISCGGGSEEFSYQIRMVVNDFPDLLRKWEEVDLLSKMEASFLKRKNDLSDYYSKNRVPVLLIADIEYQRLLSENEELHARLKELHYEIEVMKGKLSSRQALLIEKDIENRPLPEKDYEFDKVRLRELNLELFPFGRRF